MQILLFVCLIIPKNSEDLNKFVSKLILVLYCVILYPSILSGITEILSVFSITRLILALCLVFVSMINFTIFSLFHFSFSLNDGQDNALVRNPKSFIEALVPILLIMLFPITERYARNALFIIYLVLQLIISAYDAKNYC